MTFELPDAVAAMKDEVAAAHAVTSDDGDAWETVDEVLAAYDSRFELNLDPSGGDKRLEVCGLNWGRIGEDVARLAGLAAAIDNISGVIKAGRERLAPDWADGAVVAAVEKTLDDYAAAVRAAAAGMETALTSIRTKYTTYRDATLTTHLNVDEDADEEREAVQQKIRDWYDATDRLKSDVDGLFERAMENLRLLAEAKPFAALSVPPASGAVEIKDAGRTISVTGLDGDGHVKVTVEDVDGRKKSYDLDFNAASGMGRPPSDGVDRPSDPDVEHVPAGSNGKCAIEDGPLTITAERSLFDEAAIILTVEGGTGKPTTHTLDFAAEIAEEVAGSKDSATTSTAGPDKPTPARPVTATESVATPRPEAEVATGPAAESDADPIPAAESDVASGSAAVESTVTSGSVGAESPVVPSPAAESGVDTSSATAESDGFSGSSVVESDVDTGSVAAESDAASGSVVDEQEAVPSPASDAASSSAAAESDVASGRVAAESDTAPSPATEALSRSEASTPATGEPAPAVTNPQGDPSGCLSGVLVPEQPASADEPADVTDSAMPMMAGAGVAAGGGTGIGWSVHGDLFDSGDPVYSVHGVLGEDDLKSQ